MTVSDDTTTRPLYAEQYNKNGRRCSRATRRLEVDIAAVRAMHEGDREAVSYESGRSRGPVFWVTTTDHATGEAVQIAVAPCGLGCRCAAAWRRA